jgi:RNA polymerase sigma-70 factor (ECF subfamily)
MTTSSRKKIDETAFMTLLCNGNPEVIETLYDRFAGVLYGIILRTVKEESTATKLLEQTFIYIRNNYSEFDESKQNLSLWVISIARKIAQRKIPFPSYARNHNSSYNVNHKATGELSVQGQAVNTTLEIADLMTSEERKVLDLVFFGGGKIKEVANHLGLNETKVKQLLRTAVDHYRKERREVWK